MLKVGCLYSFKQSKLMFCWRGFKNFEYLTGVGGIDIVANKPFIVVANGPDKEPEFVRVIYDDQLVWIRVEAADVNKVL